MGGLSVTRCCRFGTSGTLLRSAPGAEEIRQNWEVCPCKESFSLEIASGTLQSRRVVWNSLPSHMTLHTSGVDFRFGFCNDDSTCFGDPTAAQRVGFCGQDLLYLGLDETCVRKSGAGSGVVVRRSGLELCTSPAALPMEAVLRGSLGRCQCPCSANVEQPMPLSPCQSFVIFVTLSRMPSSF